MTDDPAGTRLPYATYLAHLRADTARLVDVATDLAAPVPSCPGWTVGDLVEHVGLVFRHKVQWLQEGHRPSTWPPEVSDASVVDELRTWGDTLAAELEGRGPDDAAPTWWPTEQTAGFWARRMAHEALVHRVDAELAADLPSAVDEALGADGTDEVLTRFLADPDHAWPVREAPPVSALVRVEGRSGWLVSLEPDAVTVKTLTDGNAEAAGADAVMSGTGADLDLWLWGRGELDGLRAEGSAAVVALLSERMLTATQ